jgi:hypothetical protein
MRRMPDQDTGGAEERRGGSDEQVDERSVIN